MQCRHPSTLSIVVLLVSAFTSAARAADQHVQASLIADTDAIVPGRNFMLGVQLKMAPHWHTYWVNPGESGQGSTVTAKGPASLTFGQIQWPLPAKIDAPGGFSYGYEDSVLLMVPVTVAENFAGVSPAEITVDVTWLSCSGEVCVEGSAKALKISLPVAKEAKPANAALFEQWRSKVPVAVEKAQVVEVGQKLSPEGSPTPELQLNWKKAVKSVQFFPEATTTIAIENVAVEHAGQMSTVRFKPTVFKRARGTDGTLNGVIVYEDDKGRHGVRATFKVDTGKK